MQKRVCKNCGRTFIPRKSFAKTCSDSCSKQYWYKKYKWRMAKHKQSEVKVKTISNIINDDFEELDKLTFMLKDLHVQLDRIEHRLIMNPKPQSFRDKIKSSIIKGLIK